MNDNYELRRLRGLGISVRNYWMLHYLNGREALKEANRFSVMLHFHYPHCQRLLLSTCLSVNIFVYTLSL